MIHRKHLYCRAANVSNPFDVDSTQTKVGIPVIQAGIKQQGMLSRPGVDTSKIWPLVPIAEGAREREIVQNRRTPVLGGDNVIYPEPKLGSGLRRAAILASFASSGPDRLINRLGNGHLRRRGLRAD